MDRTVVPPRKRASRAPDALVLAAFLVLAALLSWKGLFLGQLYDDEDVLSYFFTARSRLFALAHGSEAFSWWDPLTQLGIPRLANPQCSFFSPLSQLFYWIEPTRAWAVYPFVAFSLLLAVTYAMMRSLELEPLPAVFGALSWFFVGVQLYSLQQPAIFETILWLPAVLACWEMHRRRRRVPSLWLSLFCLSLIFELCAGYPVQQLGNLAFVLLWIAAECIADRSWRLALEAAGAVGVAIAAVAFQLIGVAEVARHTSRTLVESQNFSQAYQQTPLELAAYLVREVHLFLTLPPMQFMAPYPQDPGLAGISLGFAVIAMRGHRKLRLKIAWALAILFALGSLGTAGGVLPLLLWLAPVLKVLRSSFRLISMATLALAYAAGVGCQSTLSGRLRLVPIVWLVALGLLLDYPYLARRWAPPESYRVPEALFSPVAGRVYLDFMHVDPKPSPFLMNAPMLAGKGCLELQDALVLRRTFEGIFYSQLDPKNWDKMRQVIGNANLVPFNYPEAPLMRAFGLASVLRRGELRQLPGSLPAQWVVHRTVLIADLQRRIEMASSRTWDPATTALVEEPLELPDGPTSVRVVQDTADRQSLLVDGGGLLIESSAFYPGWTCTVDGQSARILPVDIGLRGVVLAAGSHRVEFSYRPRWLWPALALAALALGLVLVYTAWGIRALAGQRDGP